MNHIVFYGIISLFKKTYGNNCPVAHCAHAGSASFYSGNAQ
ncbi:hypothetical protein WCP94_003840 [Bilophila wadsworthia]